MKRNGVLCYNFDALSFQWTINSVHPQFESSLEFVVFTVDGIVVQTGVIPEGSDGFIFDVSSLPNGVYTFVLNSPKPIFRKFVITK